MTVTSVLYDVILAFAMVVICSGQQDDHLCLASCSEDNNPNFQGKCMNNAALSACVKSNCSQEAISFCHISNDCHKLLGQFAGPDSEIEDQCRTLVNNSMCFYYFVTLNPQTHVMLRSELMAYEKEVKKSNSKRCVEVTAAMVKYVDSDITEQEFHDVMKGKAVSVSYFQHVFSIAKTMFDVLGLKTGP